LFLERLVTAHHAGRLQFFGEHARLGEHKAFTAYLAPLRKTEWVVYAKRPFGGPEAVLAYLSRYTHRVAIANSRLVAFDDAGVTFRWKDYRANGRERFKVMTLAVDEFIRRFLLHVLPSGFHRIRHYGLFANGGRAENIARARQLLNVLAVQSDTGDADDTVAGQPQALSYPCPCCGGHMVIIETFERGSSPRYQPPTSIRIDSS
jgi:Putative transposase